MLFRRIRRKLREIEYHSATRSRSTWSRATDVMLIVTLLIAPLINWLCDRVIIWHEAYSQVSGFLGTIDDQTYRAIVDDQENMKGTIWSDLTPSGEWVLERVQEKRGFPLTTSATEAPPRLKINDYNKPTGFRRVQFSSDDDRWRAIADALEDANRPDAAAAAREHGRALDYYWTAWFMGSALWWIVLTFLGFIMIQLSRVGLSTMWVRRLRREHKRRMHGLCAFCGYNLRGLEFNERCPECGHLIE